MNKKPSKMQIVLLVLLLLVTGAAMYVANPFKVTDPSSPEFDPYKFNFCDYSDLDLPKVYVSMFPKGTSKPYIDKILGITGGIKRELSIDGMTHVLVSYVAPNNLCNFHIKKPQYYNFIFDHNDALVDIRSQTGTSYFY